MRVPDANALRFKCPAQTLRRLYEEWAEWSLSDLKSLISLALPTGFEPVLQP
jgi:hypothetical protein